MTASLEAERIAGLVWTTVHAFGFVVTLRLWRLERRVFYLWFALSWLSMALWGVTVGLRAINGIVLPPLASLTGLVALRALHNHVRRRFVTLYTAMNGDVHARLYEPAGDDMDTPRLSRPEVP